MYLSKIYRWITYCTSGGALVGKGGGEKGITPLHLAAEAGQEKCVSWLLEAGAIPGHLWNEDRVSPVFLAASRGRASAIDLLMPRLTARQKNMVHVKTGHTPLTAAIEGRHCAAVSAVRARSLAFILFVAVHGVMHFPT